MKNQALQWESKGKAARSPATAGALITAGGRERLLCAMLSPVTPVMTDPIASVRLVAALRVVM
jgi:hypothetical protein